LVYTVERPTAKAKTFLRVLVISRVQFGPARHPERGIIVLASVMGGSRKNQDPSLSLGMTSTDEIWVNES
jgi:hypothetical protein